jgi:hypothetical protein
MIRLLITIQIISQFRIKQYNFHSFCNMICKKINLYLIFLWCDSIVIKLNYKYITLPINYIIHLKRVSEVSNICDWSTIDQW